MPPATPASRECRDAVQGRQGLSKPLSAPATAAAAAATDRCSTFETLMTAGTWLAHLDAVAGDALHDLLGQLDDPAARVGQPPRVRRVLLHPGTHLRVGSARTLDWQPALHCAARRASMQEAAHGQSALDRQPARLLVLCDGQARRILRTCSARTHCNTMNNMRTMLVGAPSAQHDHQGRSRAKLANLVMETWLEQQERAPGLPAWRWRRGWPPARDPGCCASSS